MVGNLQEISGNKTKNVSFCCLSCLLSFCYLALLFFATTLNVWSKKHVKFDQGLDFLIFYLGNRGQAVEKT